MSCTACCHFDADPAWLETQLPGLMALSSAYGASRFEDGFCHLHDRLISASAGCGQERAITK